jgi:hypothetical protein
MFHFAIMLGSDSKIDGNASCGLFNNFCKVEMLDPERSELYLTVASRYERS